MEDFVSFEIAKKLEEKGFTCKYPFAMYFRNRMYYDYDDFIGDKDAIIAPTISQVLKWLREKKKYHIEFVGNACGYLFIISDIPSEGGTDRYCSDYSGPNDGGTWDKYEDCAIAGIEYVLDNLI